MRNNMTKWVLAASTFAAALVSNGALAADDTYNSNPSSSRAEYNDVSRGYLRDEVISLKPAAGVIAFTDNSGQKTSRLAGGLTFDANLLASTHSVYFGPQSGAIFSHLGAAGSNFVGTSPTGTVASDAGANLLIIPADLKLGYAFGDNFRLSAHGGGNVMYRSQGTSLDLGPSTATANSVWRIYPNAGGDLELGFGRSIALDIRPDVTITPGNTVFTGTVGLGFLIG